MAVIPAAGLGTRLFPLSLATPKELLPLGDLPAIHRVVVEARDAGVQTVVLVISERKKSLLEYFHPSAELLKLVGAGAGSESVREILSLSRDLEIVPVYQEQALGLGHAISLASEVVGQSPFLVMLPDDILEPNVSTELVDLFSATSDGVLALRRVQKEDTSRYGIATVDGGSSPWKVSGAVEKPKQAPSTLAIMGRYLLPEGAMSLLKSEDPSVLGEIQLTPVLDQIAREGRMSAIDVSPNRYYDLGTIDGYRSANAILAMEDPATSDDIVRSMKDV